MPEDFLGAGASFSTRILPTLTPPDANAAELHRLVDAGYFGFLEGLPANLQTLGRSQSAFIGRPVTGAFGGPSSLNPDFAAATFLLWSACRDLPGAYLEAIARSGGLLGAAAVLLDHIADGQQQDPANAARLQEDLVDEARRLLRSVFLKTSPFWQELDRIWAELHSALDAEAQVPEASGTMSREEFRRIGGAKAAPLVAVVAAVAQLTGREELLLRGEASLKLAGAAFQLAHDVFHWTRDVADGHTTYFIALALADGPARPGQSAKATVAESVRQGHLDVQCLRLALEWLDRATDEVASLDIPEWSDYLRTIRALVERLLLRQVASYVLFGPPGASE